MKWGIFQSIQWIFTIGLTLKNFHDHHHLLFLRSMYLASCSYVNLSIVRQVTNMKLSLDNEYFKNELKKFISPVSMVSSTASFLHFYKQNHNHNHKLHKFYGNLYVRNTSYISVVINTKRQLVQTCDSLHNQNGAFTNIATFIP